LGIDDETAILGCGSTEECNIGQLPLGIEIHASRNKNQTGTWMERFGANTHSKEIVGWKIFGHEFPEAVREPSPMILAECFHGASDALHVGANLLDVAPLVRRRRNGDEREQESGT
jgi:hypothetical protein